MRRHVTILDPEMMMTYLWAFLVVTAILIGVAVIQRVRAAYLTEDDESEDVLATLRQAWEDGELDKAEFKRVEDSFAKPILTLSESVPPTKQVKKSDVGGSLRELD